MCLVQTFLTIPAWSQQARSAEDLLNIPERLYIDDSEWQEFLDTAKEADIIFKATVRQILVSHIGFDYASVPLPLFTFEKAAALRGDLPAMENLPCKNPRVCSLFTEGVDIYAALKQIGNSGRFEITAMARRAKPSEQENQILQN